MGSNAFGLLAEGAVRDPSAPIRPFFTVRDRADETAASSGAFMVKCGSREKIARS